VPTPAPDAGSKQDENGTHALEARLSEIAEVTVSREALRAFSSNDEFNTLVLEIAKEAGCCMALVADTQTSPAPLPRDDAILAGLCIRIVKLFLGLIEATCNRKQEFQFVFARLLYDTCINLLFLQQEGSPSVFDEFVESSFRNERKLLALIEKRSRQRGGMIPIEKRMVASMQTMAADAGTSLSDIRSPERRNGYKNLYQKAQAVGFGDPYYFTAFGFPSSAVHGDWGDLHRHHLRKESGGFLPDERWHGITPQVLANATIMMLWAAERYVTSRFGDAAKPLASRLPQIAERMRTVDEAHEVYMARRQKKR